ncbi:MAG TPA: diguanylate cyclase [Candidatus Limnocylindria bacterium]|nr:diguanylate cyclase [Candidatus Limnocylindria bacterium]
MELPDKRTTGRQGGRRPALLALVFGVFLVLIAITATGLVAITSGHLASATLNATVARDASLVELFVNGNLLSSDLSGGSVSDARRTQLGERLATLTRQDQILRIEVRARDGHVLFSSDPNTVGRQPASSSALQDAFAGTPGATLSEGSPDLAAPIPAATTLVQEYLPITDAAGSTLAVMAIWRDAAPLLARLESAQRDVVIVVLGASLVLALMLFLVFRAAQARIARQQGQLIEASRRDALTGLLNHGAVVAELAAAIDRASDDGVGVALLDIDNFKLLNDTHGHDAGDEVLRRVGGLVAASAAHELSIGRYGPDEFLLFWPRADADAVQRSLAELRARLDEVSLVFGESESLPITASAGIACYPADADGVTELLADVTVALQEAKASGGNAVRLAQRADDRPVSGSFDVLQGLVIAVDTKDRYTKRHSEDVARYAVFLAQRLGLDEEMIDTIRLSGLLHDVGKIGIPDTLLRKPSKLTAQEFDIFKQHVVLGDAIVRDLPNLELVRAGIRHHHERWDGHGYLHGLEGEAIPLIARVMAVADAFSAMTTTRPYRKALPIEEALKRLGDAAGTQLQEELVATFIKGIETAPDAPLPGEEPSGLWLPAQKVA